MRKTSDRAEGAPTARNNPHLSFSTFPHEASAQQRHRMEEGSADSGQRRGENTAGVTGRSALISDLVAQLKRGEITKPELFTKLQQLQGTYQPSLAPDLSPVQNGQAQAPPPGEAKSSTQSSSHSPGFPSANGTNSPQSVGGLARCSEEESDVQPGEARQATTAPRGYLDGVATGTTGFFTAYDRQAIIQKIADERRRRAQDVRRSWPNDRQHPSHSHSSPEKSPLHSFQHDRSGQVSVATAATGPSDSEAADRSANQRPSSSSGASPSSANSAYRRVAWGNGSEIEPSPKDTATSASGVYPTSTSEEFPFPSSTCRRSVGKYAGEGQGDDNGSHQPLEGREQPSPEEHREERFPVDRHQQHRQRQQQRRRLAPSVQRRLALRAAGSGRGRFSRRCVNKTTAAENTTDADAGRKSTPRKNRVSVGPSPVLYDSSKTGFNICRASGGRVRTSGREAAYATTQDQHHVTAGRDSSTLRNSLSPARLRTPQRGAGSTSIDRRRERSSHPTPGMQQRVDFHTISGGLSPRREEGGAWVEEEGEWGTGESVEAELQYQMDGGGEGGRDFGNKRAVDGEAYRFRSFSEERARRGEELVRRELMSECTFKPKIKTLPPSYGATQQDDAPFLQRVTQWQRDKEKEAAARKVDGEEKELEDCTFAPYVSMVSRRAAVSRREALGERYLAVDERLFDESLRRDMDRSHLEAEQAAKEEEKLRQECTFKPELSTERAAAKFSHQQRGTRQRQATTTSEQRCMTDEYHHETVITETWGNYSIPRGRSRYRQAAAAVAAAAAASGEGGGRGNVWGPGGRAHEGGGSELVECTFTPAVMGARKGMDQALQYLEFDVVERLTGAAFRDPENESTYSDGACGYRNGDGGGGVRKTVGSRVVDEKVRTVFDPLRHSVQRKLVVQQAGSEKSMEVQRRRRAEEMASFHAFLSRQNRMETDKIKHIEAIQDMSAPSFKPTICPESIKIHQESNKGDFLQRVARDAAKKEHEAVRKQAAGKHDPDCTFTPQITARSSSLPVRSVVELSRGDQLRRETTQRLTKLRAEQELLADTTFRPRITEAASRMAVSRLRVVSNPNGYCAMVEMLRQRKEESILRGAIEKERKEVEGCTFKPNISLCPAYIARIARSLSATKEITNSVNKRPVPVKPDWR